MEYLRTAGNVRPLNSTSNCFSGKKKFRRIAKVTCKVCFCNCCWFGPWSKSSKIDPKSLKNHEISINF